MNLKIAQLMRLAPETRDLAWLQKALQSAIELELSTLPPYLSGQWALQDQSSTAARLISGITLDEMGHLGLACNLLRATGAQPQIFDGYDAIAYPGPLPGGVRPKCDPAFFPCDPNFQVVLGFSDFGAFTRMCMQIEYPENPVPRPAAFALDKETFPSIGQFYDAILKGFQNLDSTFEYQTDKQLQNGAPEVFIIDGLAKATVAITRIQKQGEGSSKFPFVDPEQTQLAHFYLFGEIHFGKKFVFDAARQVGDFTGDPVTIPSVFPMTPVPLGGYGANAPPEVAACDKVFTRVLQQLDQAWANKGDSALFDAIGSMLALKEQAIALLQKQVRRAEGGVFGPQFRKHKTG
jgi:Ferritin-like